MQKLNNFKIFFKLNFDYLMILGYFFRKTGALLKKCTCFFKRPTTPSEVSSLLGLSTYCSRFLKNHATITDPLRKLTRNKKDNRTKIDMKWTEEEQRALDDLKEAATGEILSYFDINYNTFMIVDASPIGLCAILMQENPKNKEDVRVIAYASRSLSDLERR